MWQWLDLAYVMESDDGDTVELGTKEFVCSNA